MRISDWMSDVCSSDLFYSEAKRNNVYPFRANLDPVEAARMRRPEPPRANYVFWGGDVSLAWAKQPKLAGGFTINCDIIVPDKANGALVATGDRKSVGEGKSE